MRGVRSCYSGQLSASIRLNDERQSSALAEVTIHDFGALRVSENGGALLAHTGANGRRPNAHFDHPV